MTVTPSQPPAPPPTQPPAPATPPPAPPTPPPAPPTPPAPPSRRTTRRVVLIAGLLLLLLVGGCAGLAAVVVPRVLDSVTAPIDVANDYLDAARAGGELAPFACHSGDRPHPELPDSQGQYLSTVEIDGRSFAEVGGSLALEDGFPARITLELRRGADQWCVYDVEVDGS